MKQGWTYKKLGEVAKISSGKSIPATEIEECYSDGLYPCYGGNGLRGYVNRYSYDGHYPIIGRVGALCGNVHLTNGKFYATEHALIVSLKTDISPKYTEYSLKSLGLRQFAKGVAQPVLSASTISEIPIPVPPLAEQERIVAELDLLSGIIEKKKAQLKAYDQLAQSIFYTTFGDPITNEKGWKVEILENLVSADCSISYGIVQPGNEVENGIPVVRPIDLVNQPVTKKGLKRIDNNISDDYKRTILKGGELLFCVRGTTGVMSFASDDLKGCNVTRGITPLSFNESINKYYAYHYLKTDSLQSLIAENTRGIALKQINMKDVRCLPILLPPLSLQQEFAEKVEAIERQKALVQQSIEQTQTLFDYTMDKYFG